MKISKSTILAYDKTYKDGYDKKYPSIELVRIEKIFFRKKGLVLDYGCGPGSNGIHLLLSGYNVVFCDISKLALKKLKVKLEKLGSKFKKKYKIINIIKNQDLFLKYKNKFDIIVCMSVFNNFGDKKNAKDYLEKFNSLLKKNGKLVIDTNLRNKHNYKKVKIQDKNYFTTNPKNMNYLEMYFPENVSEFRNLIQKSNFLVKDIGHSSFKVFSSHESEIIVSAIKKK
jgi:cyclopropane fatty-acyl-phospholipid synthase-like methyltransferase